MKSVLQLGLIGCGSLGRVHAGCVGRIPQGEFIAYCDRAEEAARSALAEFGGDYACTDPEQIFSDPRIDAVYICTRHDSHAGLAEAAARAGKHILIEKPLALRMEECERVARAAAEGGVVLMPAFKMRYYPLVQRAHEFIPSPMVVVGQMMDRRWADDHWAQDPVEGGANVHSQGCHTTDLLRYFSGSEPVRIWAAGGTMTHPGHPCIDQCTAAIQFESGCAGSWIQGDAGLPPFTSKFFFELFGNGGRSVQLSNRLKRAVFSDGEKEWTEERDEEEGFFLENVDFLSAISEGRRPPLTARDGIQATRMVLAADAAIRSGEVQTLATAPQGS